MYKSYHLLKAEKFYKYDNTMTYLSHEKYLQNYKKIIKKTTFPLLKISIYLPGNMKKR